MLNGQKGFFQPRFPPPSSILPGSPDTASYYDTAALKDTLERLCDFDRINSGKQQVSVGAVNVRNGNFVYFENTKMTLRARSEEHTSDIQSLIRISYDVSCLTKKHKTKPYTTTPHH